MKIIKNYMNPGATRILMRLLLISSFLALPTKAFAAPMLVPMGVINGYSSCSWNDGGNGYSTLKLTIDYKDEGFARPPGTGFRSRGVLVYTYDKTGSMNPSGNAAIGVSLNRAVYGTTYLGNGYAMYHGASLGAGPARDQWTNTRRMIADIEVTIKNDAIKDWPAISIRAGNFTTGDDAGEITGGAYISRYGDNGVCKVIDPTVPPAPEILMNVSAPDWDLGELPRGDSEKAFSSSKDQLCFTYTGAAVNGKNFIINASNANGVVNNRYRLKNLADASQTVPYSVKLDSGTSIVNLPNASNATIPLSNSGKTCFTPTFKTTVEGSTKEGGYSDTLTFTVVTKS